MRTNDTDAIDSDGVKCPACDRTFSNLKGMGKHYGASHDYDGPMKEYLAGKLRRLANNLGRTPTESDIEESDITPSCRTYRNYFDTVNDARAFSGLRVNERRNIPEGELLEDLRKLANKLDRSPTSEEVNQSDITPSVDVYRSNFGSFSNAQEAAGLEVTSQEVTRDELISELQRLYNELGHVPTVSDLKEHGSVSRNPYRRRFESWNAALEEAGIEPEYHPDIGEKELIAELDRLADDLGRRPTFNDMNEYGSYSAHTYVNNFGSWDSAVQEIGYDSWEPPSGEDHPLWNGGGRENYGSNWIEQRKRTLERDGYECRRCGITRSEHNEKYGMDLDVHHKQPIREYDTPEDANELSNLITLCRPCHTTVEKMAPLCPLMGD